VARANLGAARNVEFHVASVANLPFEDASLDFAFSLGVLHHVPDTVAAIRSVAEKLKPGAPLLLYLYYAFDNRPRWYRVLWQASDLIRRLVSRLPDRVRYGYQSGLCRGPLLAAGPRRKGVGGGRRHA